MKRILFIIAVSFISHSIYGMQDIMFRFLQQIPIGDTDISSVSVEREFGDSGVILNKTIELFHTEDLYVYYNLFFPKRTSDSTITIYKSRIKVPRKYRFLHGRHEHGGGTYLCFGNKKEWVLLFLNTSSSQDSAEIDIYKAEEHLHQQWMWYRTLVISEISEEINRKKRNWVSFRPKKGSLYGYYKLKENILCFANVKEEHKGINIECVKSFKIIDKKEMKIGWTVFDSRNHGFTSPFPAHKGSVPLC